MTRSETKTLAGKVRYVLDRRPELAVDPHTLAVVVARTFFYHLVPEDNRGLQPYEGDGLPHLVSLDVAVRIPSVREVAAVLRRGVSAESVAKARRESAAPTPWHTKVP